MTNFLKLLRQNARIFSSQPEDGGKTQKGFVEKTVQSKISTGHIECSFDEPNAKFSLKVQKVCAGRPKLEKQFKEFVFKNKLFRKYPLDTWKQFWQPNKIIFAKNPKCFPQSLKTTEILKILRERKVFLQKCPLDTRKTVLTTMSKNIHRIPNIFPQSPLVGVNFLEKNDNVMQEDPLNGCRKQFFNPGGTFSDICSQSFSSKLEKIVKGHNFFRKQTFPQKNCCSNRMRLWQLSQSFWANNEECSVHSRKTVTKLKKFIEKTVQSKISFGHIKCSFNEPAGSSYRTPKTLSLNFRRKIRIFSEEKYNLTQSFSITQHFCQSRKIFDQYSKKL